MRLYVLLQILRTLERLTAEIALMRLQRHVHANVGSDVVALDRGGAAVTPLAGQIEVVGALATNMALTDVVLHASQRAAKTSNGSVLRVAARYAAVAKHTWRRTYIELLSRGKTVAAVLPLAGKLVARACRD